MLLKILYLFNSVLLVFFMHINFPASRTPDEVRVRPNFTIPNPPLPITTLSNPFLFLFSFCKYFPLKILQVIGLSHKLIFCPLNLDCSVTGTNRLHLLSWCCVWSQILSCLYELFWVKRAFKAEMLFFLRYWMQSVYQLSLFYLSVL